MKNQLVRQPATSAMTQPLRWKHSTRPASVRDTPSSTRMALQPINLVYSLLLNRIFTLLCTNVEGDKSVLCKIYFDTSKSAIKLRVQRSDLVKIMVFRTHTS